MGIAIPYGATGGSQCWVTKAPPRASLNPNHGDAPVVDQKTADVWKKDVWDFDALFQTFFALQVSPGNEGKDGGNLNSQTWLGTPRRPSSRHPRPPEWNPFAPCRKTSLPAQKLGVTTPQKSFMTSDAKGFSRTAATWQPLLTRTGSLWGGKHGSIWQNCDFSPVLKRFFDPLSN